MPIDYSKYPPDWKERVERIRKRSGNRCEKCGVSNGATLYSVSLWVREIKNHKARYRKRSIWISNWGDVERLDAEEVKTVRVVLTVAHLDHDEKNHDVLDNRLMHMCQMCHLRYDADEKWQRAIGKRG